MCKRKHQRNVANPKSLRHTIGCLSTRSSLCYISEIRSEKEGNSPTLARPSNSQSVLQLLVDERVSSTREGGGEKGNRRRRETPLPPRSSPSLSPASARPRPSACPPLYSEKRAAAPGGPRSRQPRAARREMRSAVVTHSHLQSYVRARLDVWRNLRGGATGRG